MQHEVERHLASSKHTTRLADPEKTAKPFYSPYPRYTRNARRMKGEVMSKINVQSASIAAFKRASVRISGKGNRRSKGSHRNSSRKSRIRL